MGKRVGHSLHRLLVAVLFASVFHKWHIHIVHRDVIKPKNAPARVDIIIHHGQVVMNAVDKPVVERHGHIVRKQRLSSARVAAHLA